ncbi:WecB/TagA/CpsF family glycosyltransferase [Allorhizobium undicola]|uniref:WecB/TagA/CpsF family glycosyltransferase n=1 Tax=Allorhizobium undicola TaxID=78527 RepID=UPI000AB696AE|nr:WecB/TagA/CpsF family glycosyltransferase [Allorhizobium undicola]
MRAAYRITDVAGSEEQDGVRTALLIHKVRQDLAEQALKMEIMDHGMDRFEADGTAGAQSLPRRTLFGQPVLDVPWMTALGFLDHLAGKVGAHAKVAFLNAHNANVMLRDGEFRALLKDQLVLPDGVGLDLAALLIDGRPFAANLNGTDLVPALLTFMSTPRRIGLIGGRPGVLAGAVANFRQHAPWHEFLPMADGFFDDEELPIILERLEEARIDLLLVGMGTPFQEKWVARHITQRHARLVLTVGALFDFVSGTVPRAPAWMRAIRFEWLYRLLLEPSRLWRRYLIGIPQFILHVLKARRQARRKA